MLSWSSPGALRRRSVALTSLILFLAAAAAIPARAQSAAASLTLPPARKVYQRNASNYALVPISGHCDNLQAPLVEARCTVMDGGSGQSGTWTALTAENGSPLVVAGTGDFAGALTVVAGGWYLIEARVRDGAAIVSQSSVSNIGVGEVFITAGQSNAANSGEWATQAAEDRVSTWTAGDSWRHGDDPQPQATATRGSPWPSLGDALVRRLNVPVAFLCVAQGGSTIESWQSSSFALPNRYSHLEAALAETGPGGVRAVLWHQGEADVKSKTSGLLYGIELNSLILASRASAGWNVPWFIAAASYVPQFEFSNDPLSALFMTPSMLSTQMAAITGAQRQVANASSTDSTFLGPSTDDIASLGWRHDGIHFRVVGLREHGRRWADALLPYITLKTTSPAALTFTTPLNTACVARLPASIGGTVESITSPVSAYIIRKSTNQYWNGAGWVATPVGLSTSSQSRNWWLTAPLPAGNSLPAGGYRLLARAQDSRGYQAQCAIEITISNAAPVTILNPVSNGLYAVFPTPPLVVPASRYTSLVMAEGGANDDNGNAVSKVTVCLRRTLVNGTVSYWYGGSVWDAAYSSARNERPATGTLPWRFVLPTWPQGFGAGAYNLRATAIDSAGRALQSSVDFTILDSYSMGGRVTTPNGIGVPNVTVSRTGAAFIGTENSVVTNSAGYYKFTSVPSGSYTITAAAPGYVARPASLSATVTTNDLNGLNFTLYKLCTASGRVTTMDSGGNVKALGGVSVLCQGGGAQTVRTNSAGYYTLTNLTSGVYAVSPSLAGYTFVPAAASLTINNADGPAPNFTTGARISGVVSNSSGSALAGVSVSCSGSLGTSTTTTDSFGNYRFVNVPNGPYQLSAGSGCTPVTRSVTVQGANIANQNFTAGVGGYSAMTPSSAGLLPATARRPRVYG